jgi:D-beta-D-heptose 7-phosphate kinase/D-beta-D-heptose 1-phosphate adenosyltransferase
MAMDEVDWNLHDRMQNLRRSLKPVNSPKEVVLVGDVMLDRYIQGIANNLDPTAAVPVLKEMQREQGAGAAAHVARGLTSLGLSLRLFAFVGDDESGSELLCLLEDEGVNTDGVAIIEDYRTTVKIRLMASREALLNKPQLLLRWDQENDGPVSSVAVDALIDQACEAIKTASALVISDYGKGVITDEGAKRLLLAATEAGIPVISDPKLTGLHRVHGVSVALFKDRGLELLRRRGGVETAAEAANITMEQHGFGAMLVAGGANGTTLFRPNEEAEHFPCTLNGATQQIGLLDAANVAMTTALSLGLGLLDGCLLANAACEVILAGEAALETVLTGKALATRLDEAAWSMHISQR